MWLCHSFSILLLWHVLKPLDHEFVRRILLGCIGLVVAHHHPSFFNCPAAAHFGANRAVWSLFIQRGDYVNLTLLWRKVEVLCCVKEVSIVTSYVHVVLAVVWSGILRAEWRLMCWHLLVTVVGSCNADETSASFFSGFVLTFLHWRGVQWVHEILLKYQLLWGFLLIAVWV